MEKCLGVCACGKLEFECLGDPLNSVFCYCLSCQRVTNSDKWFGVWYPKDSVSFTKGKASIFIRKGDSGKNMEHMFCIKCSTTVAVFCEVGNFYSISASCLQNKEELFPNMLIYTAQAVSWAQFPIDVPKFDIIAPEMGG
ncbi:GFA family protein [Vibrio hepatarius]|uniref:GFA family protein n=1 Tax=Vibrio hepatarius TaxID=171383 RepID=UPI001C0A0D4C|nr:GFA family protein [Vibrio hepatarius]MBU2899216.1 GFA family protein [Vibrio hepatarius]